MYVCRYIHGQLYNYVCMHVHVAKYRIHRLTDDEISSMYVIRSYHQLSSIKQTRDVNLKPLVLYYPQP